jgi:hypothetical protein
VDRGLTVTVQPPGTWLRGRPAFFVLPDWQSIAIHRDATNFLLLMLLTRLEEGQLGYRVVRHVPIPPYLQRPLDEWLDPGFAVDLWQGAIGFTVYARKDLVPTIEAPDVPPADAAESVPSQS